MSVHKEDRCEKMRIAAYCCVLVVILMSGSTTPQHPHPTQNKPKRHTQQHPTAQHQARPLDKPDKPWYNTRVEDKRNKATARQLHSFIHTSLTKNRTYDIDSKSKTQRET